MYRISSLQKKLLLAALSLPVAAIAMAQDAANTAQKTVASSYNQLAILLVILTVVLAFVIWGMGQVLVELGRQLLEKSKQSQKAAGIVLLIGFSLLSGLSYGQDAASAEAPKVVSNYGGLSATTFYFFVIVIAIEVLAILFMAFSIRRMYAELLPERAAARKQSALGSWWSNLDKRFFTKATPVEKEADVMLDHDYDGIRELDNALPPWWKYGFYFTIVVGIIYLMNFHVLGYGKNPDQEYQAEMEKAKVEKALYEAQNKDKIDENNVPMADAAGIKAGQDMFEANCVACHLKGGAGSVGPNLTDDYWIHKGSLNDIYKSIKNGYPDKGMQAWITKFNPKEISQLASYVKSLHGTNPPNAKAPQGDLYTEAPAAASDSAKAGPKADSAKANAPAVKTTKPDSATAKKP
ncbi:MAG: cbb3-type cytochrome c oxidase N-terminal domain-containing protein [Ferruginibacter sp.]